MPSRSLLPFALLACGGLAGCVVEDPPAPTTVVVTVRAWPAGAAAPHELLGGSPLAFELDRTETFAALAALFGQRPLDAEWIATRHVPSEVTTVAETLVLESFECGAFLSGDGVDEATGLHQGFLLVDEPFVREAAAFDPSARGAAFAGAQFVAQKIPRPLEDGAFAWIHLDLSTVDDARGTLDDALAALRDALAGDPAAVTVLASLDPTTPGAPLAIRAHGARLPSPVAVTEFGNYLRAEMARSLAAAEAEGIR